MATKPAPLGWRGTARFVWRQLTSMQTALILLLLLALAAIPGSLFPQRDVNPALTESFINDNGRWAEILDALGFFHVFNSPWFAAIYLLLFVSLIGCILPRIRAHAIQLRSKPPRTPFRLQRFVGYTRRTVPGKDPSALIDSARDLLRSQHYRTVVFDEGDAVSVSSERGYLRETGNLIFHIGLVLVLASLAAGSLTQYRGQVTVIEGEGVTNSLAHYDSFQSGAWFNAENMPPFHLTLTDFEATYEADPASGRVGEPRDFTAHVDVRMPDGHHEQREVQVNRPVDLPGASIFLLGNGYAPEVTLRDPTGAVVAEGAVITVPMGDMGYTSQLVIKAPDANPEQLALAGFFLPTGRIDQRGPHSIYPDLLDPMLVMTAYTGDLGLDEGIPRNVYELDVSQLQQVTDDAGQPVLLRMSPGQSMQLPDGSTVEFTGVRRYAAFDIAYNAFERWTLVFALITVAGLVMTLFVPRRRVWVRARAVDGGARMEVAGLTRTEDAGLAQRVHELADLLAGEDADLAPVDEEASGVESSTTTAAPESPKPSSSRAPSEGPSS